jgi:oxygen-independent coproporphyrinogen III oxidase
MESDRHAPGAPAPGARASGAVQAAVAALEGPCYAAAAAARTGLYVHVPFCVRRCAYCDFSSGLASAAGVSRWLAALEREIGLRAGTAAGASFSSVFLGGGTPSVLAPEVVARLFGALRAAFSLAPDAEITLEANPESVDEPRLAAWRAAGVNRLSLGAQSFDDAELARLGRAHDAEAVDRAVGLARRAGFERLSLDLIFGFPGHAPAAWERTLDRALALGTGHLSAYALIPEAGTPLGDAVLEGRLAPQDDEGQAWAYECLTARAAAAGLGCYETSNFCRPGEEARHNLVYWLRRPYLGLGPSAHGLWRGERYGNRRARAAWARALEGGGRPESAREVESAEGAAREIVLLGLRLARGLDPAHHAPGSWERVRERYAAALAEAVATGRLVASEGRHAVPRAHRYLADDVIAWLEARAAAHAG